MIYFDMYLIVSKLNCKNLPSSNKSFTNGSNSSKRLSEFFNIHTIVKFIITQNKTIFIAMICKVLSSLCFLIFFFLGISCFLGWIYAYSKTIFFNNYSHTRFAQISIYIIQHMILDVVMIESAVLMIIFIAGLLFYYFYKIFFNFNLAYAYHKFLFHYLKIIELIDIKSMGNMSFTKLHNIAHSQFYSVLYILINSFYPIFLCILIIPTTLLLVFLDCFLINLSMLYIQNKGLKSLDNIDLLRTYENVNINQTSCLDLVSMQDKLKDKLQRIINFLYGPHHFMLEEVQPQEIDLKESDPNMQQQQNIEDRQEPDINDIEQNQQEQDIDMQHNKQDAGNNNEDWAQFDPFKIMSEEELKAAKERVEKEEQAAKELKEQNELMQQQELLEQDWQYIQDNPSKFYLFYFYKMMNIFLFEEINEPINLFSDIIELAFEHSKTHWHMRVINVTSILEVFVIPYIFNILIIVVFYFSSKHKTRYKLIDDKITYQSNLQFNQLLLSINSFSFFVSIELMFSLFFVFVLLRLMFVSSSYYQVILWNINRFFMFYGISEFHYEKNYIQQMKEKISLSKEKLIANQSIHYSWFTGPISAICEQIPTEILKFIENADNSDQIVKSYLMSTIYVIEFILYRLKQIHKVKDEEVLNYLKKIQQDVQQYINNNTKNFINQENLGNIYTEFDTYIQLCNNSADIKLQIQQAYPEIARRCGAIIHNFTNNSDKFIRSIWDIKYETSMHENTNYFSDIRWNIFLVAIIYSISFLKFIKSMIDIIKNTFLFFYSLSIYKYTMSQIKHICIMNNGLKFINPKGFLVTRNFHESKLLRSQHIVSHINHLSTLNKPQEDKVDNYSNNQIVNYTNPSITYNLTGTMPNQLIDYLFGLYNNTYNHLYYLDSNYYMSINHINRLSLRKNIGYMFNNLNIFYTNITVEKLMLLFTSYNNYGLFTEMIHIFQSLLGQLVKISSKRIVSTLSGGEFKILCFILNIIKMSNQYCEESNKIIFNDINHIMILNQWYIGLDIKRQEVIISLFSYLNSLMIKHNRGFSTQFIKNYFHTLQSESIQLVDFECKRLTSLMIKRINSPINGLIIIAHHIPKHSSFDIYCSEIINMIISRLKLVVNSTKSTSS